MNKTLEGRPLLTFLRIITAPPAIINLSVWDELGWKMVIHLNYNSCKNRKRYGLLVRANDPWYNSSVKTNYCEVCDTFFVEGSSVWLPVFTLSRAAVPASVSRLSLESEPAPSWGELSETGPDREAEIEASQQTGLEFEIFLLKLGKKERKRRNVTFDE